MYNDLPAYVPTTVLSAKFEKKSSGSVSVGSSRDTMTNSISPVGGRLSTSATISKIAPFGEKELEISWELSGQASGYAWKVY